jgi:hypothetical protein
LIFRLIHRNANDRLYPKWYGHDFLRNQFLEK